MAHVEFGTRVERDLRRAQRSGELPRTRRAIADLEAEVQGLDIVALQGSSPWRRLRAGDWRIVFRPLTPDEMRQLGRRNDGLLVARIVNRRDLDRAISAL